MLPRGRSHGTAESRRSEAAGGAGTGRGGRAPPQARVGAARPVATVTGRGKTGAGAGPGPGVSLVLPVPQVQVSGRENAPRQAQQASAATWRPGLRWAGWREKEEAALGSVSETELLGTPGGSSCSEPEPRATLGGSGGARNSKGREVRAGSRSPPQVRRECFRKQGPEDEETEAQRCKTTCLKPNNWSNRDYPLLRACSSTPERGTFWQHAKRSLSLLTFSPGKPSLTRESKLLQ
ncbi:uncharacterized protein LOC113602449 [Acinonyx jubatus]|uniref:Uncharacterized protein LOC113602449 n=1 Tax=Acinonyx jubatus TaxID=32536 RepID=A0ABM3PKD3_ACIJB|nr:uncharacterized protein LOC113602449 [Acinonyx jubatus]